jgi:TM2 domain-containing membrane protein YozV
LSACGVIGEIILEQSDEGFIDIRENFRKSENPRLVAIGLDLALGLFGMHRLYLGTDVKVPVAYTLTFGGGGILWLVDLALLIGSPSIESYKNNPHLFMWIPPSKTAQ